MKYDSKKLTESDTQANATMLSIKMNLKKRFELGHKKLRTASDGRVHCMLIDGECN
jgi:hypothetical protein